MTPGPGRSARAVGERGTRSVSFDRAVGFYDLTRRVSPDAAARVAEIMADELRGRGRCLEIGVGNGRIALPLHGRSIPMAGIDLSMKMIRSMVDRADGAAPFPLAVADAIQAPFRDGTFGAAIACHVLHLIRPWRRALGEMARVVRPGGVVLVDVGGSDEGWWGEVQKRFCREVGIRRRYLGVHDPEKVDAAMEGSGAHLRLLPVVSDSIPTSVAERIDWLEQGIFSFTWKVDEPVRRRAAAVLRPWAQGRFGPLDEARELPAKVRWRAYDLS
jgi:ubiquinone/menaquinone biosynthesis C-methylase UbiE